MVYGVSSKYVQTVAQSRLKVGVSMKKRVSGILMPISSLPGRFGIGDFGKGAYDFVDFLESSRQKNWQILPLGITGYGDSPYQSFSAYAGNPYFIDLNEFIVDSYLTEEDLKGYPLGDDPRWVDYEKLYFNKYPLLRIAFERSYDDVRVDLEDYYLRNSHWLREFSIFMAIKEVHEGKSWLLWDENYKNYNSKDVEEFERQNKKKIDFWVFTQFHFQKQWLKLKEYANSKEIKIIGDLPIYVSEDSSDVWAHPEYFKLDEEFAPITVAGVPPDYFTATGQLWGNPIYDWQIMEEKGYDFWIKRVAHSFDIYDTLRIDHFRGFEAYWEVPYGSENAVNGRWVKGPGLKLFNKIKEALGELDIIAEDLGFQTPEVVQLIQDTGFPGMKILQFAFDPVGDSDYLPHNHERNSIVYTGTHDNKTVRDWYETAPEDELNYAIKYLKLDEIEGYSWGLIRGAWGSNAYLAIAQIQDFLDLGEEARLNTPSTIGNNWTWRVQQESLNKELSDRIKELTLLYRRGKID